jgi:hypothetical protein
MKNITDVRAELSKVFVGLKNGSINPSVASELNNSAGKIINSVKIELEYYALRKEKPEIEFLKNT